MARMLLTMLCDFSTHLHLYHYTVIQPGQSTACKCTSTNTLLEGGMNIVFWMLDLSCLQLYFCFAIVAERSSAEVCISVCYVIVPATIVKSRCYFNSDFVCWRTIRAMPDWFYTTFVCGCSV
jgi:hypothetical protein